jgi:hypothetical protein
MSRLGVLIIPSFVFVVCSGDTAVTTLQKNSVTDTGSPAMLQPPDSDWLSMYSKAYEPLQNRPKVISIEERKGEIQVTIKNTGTTIIDYYATSSSRIQLFQEEWVNREWIAINWDWCGLGKKHFELNPNETTELSVRFWDDEIRERMLGRFSEKGTLRSGMIVLAAEPQ